MVWDDIKYDDETYLPDGSMRSPDSVEINVDLHRHYQKWIAIRNAHSALRIGDYQTLIADDEKDLFAFRRSFEEEHIFVVFNNAWEDQEVQIPIERAVEIKDLSSDQLYLVKHGICSIKLPGKTGTAFYCGEPVTYSLDIGTF